MLEKTLNMSTETSPCDVTKGPVTSHQALVGCEVAALLCSDYFSSTFALFVLKTGGNHHIWWLLTEGFE